MKLGKTVSLGWPITVLDLDACHPQITPCMYSLSVSCLNPRHSLSLPLSSLSLSYFSFMQHVNYGPVI